MTTTLRPNAAVEQFKRKMAAQLARIHSQRAAALSRVNARYDGIEQDWYATVPPEWHVAIREAATRSMEPCSNQVKKGDDLRVTLGDCRVVDVTVNGRSMKWNPDSTKSDDGKKTIRINDVDVGAYEANEEG